MSMLPALKRVAGLIDALNEGIGRFIAWFTLLMVVVTFAVVVLRYGFSMGWIAMQESVMYLHGYLFMLGAAYALKHDGHVRVDVFYNHMSPRARGWVDLLGSLLFLAPTCLYIAYSSWDYVMVSWARNEASPETGGIPFVYVLKSAILGLAFLLLLQGASQAIKALAEILGQGELPHTREGQEEL